MWLLPRSSPLSAPQRTPQVCPQNMPGPCCFSQPTLAVSLVDSSTWPVSCDSSCLLLARKAWKAERSSSCCSEDWAVLLEVWSSPFFLCLLWPLPSHLLLLQNIHQELSLFFTCPLLLPPSRSSTVSNHIDLNDVVCLSISLCLECYCSWLVVHLSIIPLLAHYLPRRTVLVHSVKQ